jgi:drug/metabolite transporter (DMT)-like permease
MGRGIALKIAATLAFAMMSALIKASSARFAVAEVVLFRSLFALAVLLLWLWRRGDLPDALKTQRPLGHIGRSLAGSCGMTASFLVLALLPLADATAFTFVTPLIVVPLAAMLLGEIVRPYRWAAVGLGFAGVLVMLSERLGGATNDQASLGVAIALAGALFSAAAMIQTRRLTLSEPTGAIVFYFTSVTMALSAFALIVFGLWPLGLAGSAFAASQAWITPGPAEFVALALVGVLGGAGQILMTHSYRFADASVIAAFDYVAMIWAAALGFAFFGEAPTPRVILGAVIVAAAGISVLWRERALRRIASA